MRAWGIAAWLAALLTVVNLFACPRYRYSSIAGTFELKATRDGQVLNYQHLDAVWFAGVEIAILATLAGACLLRHEAGRLWKDFVGDSAIP